jgi:Leucine-rich repeat (LRR) protein
VQAKKQNKKEKRCAFPMGNQSSVNDSTVDTVTFLDLSHQGLTDLKSQLASGYVNLTELNLSNNKLTTLQGIYNIAPNLQTLDLSSNQVQNWTELYSLVKLKALRARMCRIPQIDGKISYLKLLTELDLSHNTIKVLPPQIGSLQNLMVLILTSNSLRELPKGNNFDLSHI